METEPSQLTPAGRRAVLAVAIGAIIVDTLLLGIVVPLLPTIQTRTGTGEAGVGLALAAYAIPLALVSIPFGALADRIGRRPLLVGGLLLTAAGSVLIAVSESLTALVAGRMVQGVGGAGSWIAALALVSDLSRPGRRGEAIGFALAANSAGAIAGPALGGVAGGTIGFAAPFLIVAVAAVGLTVASLAAVPRDQPDQAARGRTLLRTLAVVRRPAVLPATAIAIGGATALGMVEVVAPLDLDERLGLSAAAIGVIFGGAIAVDAAVAPVAGAASDRAGRPPVAALGLALIAISAVMLVILDGTLGALAGLCVFGGGVSAAFAAAVPWLDESFGALDRGMAYGALNLLYSIGYAAGPLLAGAMYEASGPSLPYWSLGTAAALGVAVLLVAGRRSSSQPSGAES